MHEAKSSLFEITKLFYEFIIEIGYIFITKFLLIDILSLTRQFFWMRCICNPIKNTPSNMT